MPRQGGRFRPGLLLSLFAGFFLPVFLILGTWQLNRGYEKTQLEARLTKQTLLKFNEVNWARSEDYSSFAVTANVLPEPMLLLDNKTFEGRPGYEVFVFASADASLLLVSLGWVAGTERRDELPRITLPTRLNQVVVQQRPFPKNPIFDSDTNSQHSSNENVWIVQSLDNGWLKNQFAVEVLSAVQMQESAIFGVGPNIWQPSVMSSTRHYGYALQWFLMAGALLVMYLYAGFKNNNNSER